MAPFPVHQPSVFERIHAKVAETVDRAVATGASLFCKECQRELPATDFARNRGMLTCRSCLQSFRRHGREDRRGADPFSLKLRSLRAGAAKRGYEFAITPMWCHDQWDRQEGRCAYSFMPLELRLRRGPLECSFDRVDPAGGYRPDNVVLCAWAFNVFKSNMKAVDCFWLFEAMAANRRDKFPDWHQRPDVVEHLRKLRGVSSSGEFVPLPRPPGRKQALVIDALTSPDSAPAPGGPTT